MEKLPMKPARPILIAIVALLSASAEAHETYNVSGYGAGLAGSTNGADGSPTIVPPAQWTEGSVGTYTGALPAHWYAGVHEVTTARTIQTGLAPEPPRGSLLDQVLHFNDENDPDLPEDLVLAVGGLSWSDPGNGDQGWGHGLDFGLIQLTPLESLLEDGPVQLTVTLLDDPSDGAATRLAFALYGGWDTSPTSVRHQTFTTSPLPVDDPLGSSGLTLLDHAVAGEAGETLSRTLAVDAAFGGTYTLVIGALGGVPGQYQVTIATSPDLALAMCEVDLDTATGDADADGALDVVDGCPATPAGEAVDAAGCGLTEFCAGFEVASKAGRKACKKADWQNDEPTMKGKQRDCRFDKGAALCAPAG